MRIGICGGGFGGAWLPLVATHPGVTGVAVAEANPAMLADMLGVVPGAQSYPSFDEMIADPDLDAVGIFTPPWLHAEHTIAALRAGKHVLCAVPLGLTLDEIAAVVEEVERTGLVYMTGETSAAKPAFLYCRERFRRGDLGDFVMGKVHNLYNPARYGFYNRDFYANFPPMFYATHTVSTMVGITGRRLRRVAAYGYPGLHPEMRGHRRLPLTEDNEFGNESGFFLLEGGGNAHVTEARWSSHPASDDDTFTIYGTDAAFEQANGGETWYSADPQQAIDLHQALGTWEVGGLARDLPAQFLEAGWRTIGYLVDDFVRAVTTGRRAFNDVWQAARYCAPGIVAHASAQRDGEWLDIPDFGESTAGSWVPDELDRAIV
jgi:predicted dehydrogenase